ncbi:MAG: PKD domain-containing protein [Bacteroidia bacterium]|nr:PKD domain-containing protein [Bacteroidia bacterium]MDW8089354.1 PKD domain-containing protein [Bacteroidia bacterium]
MRQCLVALVLGGVVWARHGGTFVENKGQIYAEVRFEAVFRGQHIYLTDEGIALLLVDTKFLETAHWQRWGGPIPVQAHFVRIRWVGAAPVVPIGEEPEPTLYNFFQGPWRATGARGFRRVVYPNLYPGVTLAFTLTPQGLKWDWIGQSAEALRAIRLRYEGVGFYLADSTQLILETCLGPLPEQLPKAYNLPAKANVPIRYKIDGALIRYEVLSEVSGSVVIDPVIVFSTYSGSYSDNWGFTATYDLQGNAFAGGIVNDVFWNDVGNGIRFPVTPGVIQSTYGGGVDYNQNQPLFWQCDMALWKTNPTGTVRLWATYLGGSDNEQPHSIATDPQGNLYIMGASRSPNFPTTSNAYQTTRRGDIDIVVSCISADGGTLLGSTYIGGTGEDGLNSRVYNLYYFYADDGRGEIVVGDTACYIISSTRSSDFPTSSNAYQTSLRGGMDAVICKFSLDLRFLYASTYLGGSGADAGYSIRLGRNGEVYVAGGTNSSDFPTTNNAYQSTYQGGRADGWLASLSSNLEALQSATYWGTRSYDQVFMIDLDRQGNVWGAGHTEGNLSSTPGAYSNPGGKQFVFTLNPNLTQLTRLSVWGSGRSRPDITISAFAADRCGYVYVAGWGGLEISNGVRYGSTLGLPTTANANQRTTDGADFYVVAFQPGLTGLAYASFWGGNLSEEHVDGGTSRFDNRGIIYQSVCAGCGGNLNDFPTTPGTISNTNNSPNCNNALFKIDFQLGDPVVAAMALTPSGGCAPLRATIQNLSQQGTTYEWDFGNGQTFTGANPPPVTYTQPGTYTITLIAINPFTCNQRDTLRRIVNVYPRPNANFSFQTNCRLGATFSPVATEPGLSYEWDFGDGRTSRDPRPTHTYTAAGTYTVQLIVRNSQNCADTVRQPVSVRLSNVRADFTWEGDICRGVYRFVNRSENAQSYTWIIAGRDTLRTPNPTYTFSQSGTYEVVLIAYDAQGCTDTLRREVVVSRIVRAGFSLNVDYCALRVAFQNSSEGAGTYEWDFGDGTQSTEPNPTHTYAQPGSYTVQLIAVSADGRCRDTVRQTIEIDFRSEARAEVRVDTCRGVVVFVSRSRFANSVEWQVDNWRARGDSVAWSSPAPGTYTWQLITNPDGSPLCRDTLVGTVVVPERRRLDSLPWQMDICEGLLYLSLPLPPDRLVQLAINGNTYPLVSSVSLPIQSGTTYTITLVYLDEVGCLDTLRYTLTADFLIGRALFVPNVFTPNGDGINDVFRVLGHAECVEELAIYDRWGQEIYRTRVLPFVWDGRRGGEMAPEGAYVYVIKLRGFVRAGTVTLLR